MPRKSGREEKKDGPKETIQMIPGKKEVYVPPGSSKTLPKELKAFFDRKRRAELESIDRRISLLQEKKKKLESMKV